MCNTWAWSVLTHNSIIETTFVVVAVTSLLLVSVLSTGAGLKYRYRWYR